MGWVGKLSSFGCIIFFGRELAQMLFVLFFFGQAQNLDIRKHFLDLFSQGMMFSQKLTGVQEFF